MDGVFFSGWAPLLRTLVATVLAYPALVAVLRISGKRTLAQMNAFDFIVTVALGSTLASILVSNNVSIVQGVQALVLLVALQFLVAWSSVRAGWFQKLVKSEPRMILRDGEVLEEALLSERFSKDEVVQALREQGIADFSSVQAVVLETNGRISVVRTSQGAGEALDNVRGAKEG
jgi:uncharacterized membrane protein YcaP (DUF421 family)